MISVKLPSLLSTLRLAVTLPMALLAGFRKRGEQMIRGRDEWVSVWSLAALAT